MIIYSQRILFICFCFICLFSTKMFAESSYHLEISKQQQNLRLLEGEKEIKRYQIAYGKGGKHNKKLLGDELTPEGHYRINHFKLDSKFTLFMQLDYPNQTDAWHAYRDKRISAETYKRIVKAISEGERPPQDTELGGYIGIHGMGKNDADSLDTHKYTNWTKGCIALTDNEILELKQYASIGMPVYIRP